MTPTPEGVINTTEIWVVKPDEDITIEKEEEDDK